MIRSQPWWQTSVVYQIYPRSFQDSTGNGIGDLAGITRRLPYLSQTLGVGAIWISPFYRSPMADFGYDVADYTDVDPLFGNMDDFDALLARAHDLGLRVIIDWVPNHTSDEHAWFRASRSSRDDPRRDWYVWRDRKSDGSVPNNWLSYFGGSAWEWDAGTEQYYLHSFLAEQPDLNWRNPGVQAAMFEGVRFWLDRGVDGLRIDVAHLILKDPAFRDNPPTPGNHYLPFKDHGEYDRQLHLYDKGHPDTHSVYRELRALLDSYVPERFAVGEIHVADLDDWASYYGAAHDELHMPFNFALIHMPWTAAAIRQHVEQIESAVPHGAWPNYVLGNHDETRLYDRVGPERMRLAALLLLTLRGTPTIYYGDEIGIPDAPIPPERQQDPHGRRQPGAGRDGCRTPMLWDRSPNAGFTPDPKAEPWLPLSSGWRQGNVETQLERPDSLLNLTRRLIALRQSEPALQVGAFKSLEGTPGDVFGYSRDHEGRRLIILLNFSRHECALVSPTEGRVLLTTAHRERPSANAGGDIRLDPWEGLILG
jgi:glycosidase